MIVSTVSYLPRVPLVTTCDCVYVAFREIITPSFIQMTVVAGPPEDVQVRVAAARRNLMWLTLGVPGRFKSN